MKNTTVIRGRPIYIYHGSQYLELPDKCVIRKVVYDAETNTSTVYCRSLNKFVEFACLCVIIACVFLNIMYLHELSYSINYSSLAMYYNGELFVNVYNDNDTPITCTLLKDDNPIYTTDIAPHDYLITVPIDDVNGNISLTFTINRFLRNISETVNITIVSK